MKEIILRSSKKNIDVRFIINDLVDGEPEAYLVEDNLMKSWIGAISIEPSPISCGVTELNTIQYFIECALNYFTELLKGFQNGK